MEDLFFDDEYRYEDYKDKIKDVCFACGAHIPGTWDYYLKNGNCCQECNIRYAHLLRKLITKEQSLERLLHRRKLVKSGLIK